LKGNGEFEGEWRGGGKEGVSGINRRYWEEGLWGLIFHQNMKPSSSRGTKKGFGGLI